MKASDPEIELGRVKPVLDTIKIARDISEKETG